MLRLMVRYAWGEAFLADVEGMRLHAYRRVRVHSGKHRLGGRRGGAPREQARGDASTSRTSNFDFDADDQ
jgi:hypothetical protein